MPTITLSRGLWSFDERRPLGPKGGFGSVYAGTGPNGNEVAVKILHLDAPGPVHRELVMANLLVGHTFKHVLPVFDAGLDPSLGRYAIVMALAEKSLQDEIGASAPLAESVAAGILHQVALGLIEVEQIVHRDLKPGNVLLHEGLWKLSDFGIARLVEAATSKNTLKEFLSPAYAAPEQWRTEQSTHATDVYALGCIGYALVTGRPPFTGAYEDVKFQHLSAVPEIPPSTAPAFASQLRVMLRKQPSTRPSLRRAARQLEQLSRPPPEALAPSELAAAAGRLAARQSAQEVEELADASELDARRRRARAALQLLEEYRDLLYGRVFDQAPNAELTWLGSGVGEQEYLDWKAVTVGDASLSIRIDHPFVEGSEVLRPDVGRIELAGGWDIVALAEITVSQAIPEEAACQRILAYRDDGTGGETRWYEHWLVAKQASANGDRCWGLSLESCPIDDEDFDNFSRRWLSVLAAAILGELRQTCEASGLPSQ